MLEFGALTPVSRRDGTSGQSVGELTLAIEWSWRIERPRSILGGSWSDERRWPSYFERLIGNRVTRVATFGPLHEVELSLSNGLRVVSFKTAQGQPGWSLVCRSQPKATVRAVNGRLRCEALECVAFSD